MKHSYSTSFSLKYNGVDTMMMQSYIYIQQLILRYTETNIIIDIKAKTNMALKHTVCLDLYALLS